MGILITPESALCGGKSCYAFPNGNLAHNRTCPGKSITRSLMFGGTSKELDCTHETLYDECQVGDLEESFEDANGCKVTTGICMDCVPEYPGAPQPNCGTYRGITTCCCKDTYRTESFFIDPNSDQFKDAIGWKIVSCMDDKPQPPKEILTNIKAVYLTGGKWMHVYPDNDGSSFTYSIGGTGNAIEFPFFQNGSTDIIQVKTRKQRPSEKYCAETLRGMTGSCHDDDLGVSCVDYYVLEDSNGNIYFSGDEVYEYINLSSDEGVVEQDAGIDIIPEGAAIFTRGGSLFRSNQSFEVSVVYQDHFCLSEDDLELSLKCTEGMGITAITVDSNASACNILDTNPVNLIK